MSIGPGLILGLGVPVFKDYHLPEPRRIQECIFWPFFGRLLREPAEIRPCFFFLIFGTTRPSVPRKL